MKLSNPIKLALNNDGYEYTFSTLKEFQNWINKEQSNWTSWQEEWKQQPREVQQLYPLLFSNIISALEDIQTRLQHAESSNDVASLIESVIIFTVKELHISSQSPKGIFIGTLLQEAPLLATATLAFWEENLYALQDWGFHDHGNRVSDFQRKRRHNFLLSGAANAHSFEQGIKGTATAERKKLKTLCADVEEIKSSLLAKQEEWNAILAHETKEQEEQTKHWEDLKKQLTLDATTTLLGHENFYKERMAYEAPVTYWSRQADMHKRNALIWMVWLIAGVTVLFCATRPYLNYIRTFFSENTHIDTLAAVVMVTLPVFVYVWFLKFLQAGYRTHTTKMHDAAERTTMTKTYLSLLSEDKASEQDKILILSALFRPSAQTQNDDGTPVHWFDLLLERTKNVSG